MPDIPLVIRNKPHNNQLCTDLSRLISAYPVVSHFLRFAWQTTLASVKMPIDLFVGKSSVQTNIYVFKVGEPHHAKNTVKFIDFSNDGYTRTNRKKASVNLRDTDHAKERYQEIADIVRFGKSELNIFTDKEYYEGKIDPENGADWNQSAPIDTIPTLEDFKKTVSDYLAWEVSTLLKGKSSEDNERLGK